jgi:hypothetical protein
MSGNSGSGGSVAMDERVLGNGNYPVIPKPAKDPSVRTQNTRLIQKKRPKKPDPWPTACDISLHLIRGGETSMNWLGTANSAIPFLFCKPPNCMVRLRLGILWFHDTPLTVLNEST